jgi:hypothetical protein
MSSSSWESWLAPRCEAASRQLQEALRQQTTRRVRRRAVRRRALWAVLAAACVGSAVLLWLRPWLGPAPVEDERQHAQQPESAPVPERPPEPEPSALALEWQAFDSKEDRAARYFRAGNAYLEQHYDHEAALRCYRQALAYCRADDLEFDSSDSWLLMTLKNERRKELDHD